MRSWLRQAVFEQPETAANTRILTTNQKVAGSSPAERAKESPANCWVLLFLEPLLVRVYHLSDHLRAAERAFQGPARVGLVPLNLSAKRPITSSWMCGSTWAQTFMVTSMRECPRISCRTFTGSLLSSQRVAKVCRRV